MTMGNIVDLAKIRRWREMKRWLAIGRISLPSTTAPVLYAVNGRIFDQDGNIVGGYDESTEARKR